MSAGPVAAAKRCGEVVVGDGLLQETAVGFGEMDVVVLLKLQVPRLVVPRTAVPIGTAVQDVDGADFDRIADRQVSGGGVAAPITVDGVLD